MGNEKDRDLQDVLREERSRGRRERVDIDAEQKRKAQEAAIAEIYSSGTEQDLRGLMKQWNVPQERIEAAVKLFRALRGL